MSKKNFLADYIFKLFIMIIISILISCSSKIERIGYTFSDTTSNNCEVIFFTDENFKINRAQYLGNVTIFNLTNDTNEIQRIFHPEACMADANLIHLYKSYETNPGFFNIIPPRMAYWANFYHLEDYDFEVAKKNMKHLYNLGINIKNIIIFSDNFEIGKSCFNKTTQNLEKKSKLHTKIQLEVKYDVWFGDPFFYSHGAILPYESYLLDQDNNAEMMNYFYVQFLITEIYAKKLLNLLIEKKVPEDDWNQNGN